MSERDTHFQRTAKPMLNEMEKLFFEHYIVVDSIGNSESNREARQTLIAQFAYDLAVHILNLVPGLIQAVPDARISTEIIPYIPDMTAWPED